jgi:hypothetical protein
VAADVVVVVHFVGVLLGVLFGPDLVDLVHALGLGELVNLGTDEAGDGLLGKGVADGLACLLVRKSITDNRQNDMPSLRWWSS